MSSKAGRLTVSQKQIASITAILCSTELREYYYSWYPYLEFAARTLNSEGLQAVKRLKAYNEAAVQAVHLRDWTILSSKGYKRCKPLLRLLEKADRSDNYNLMLLVFTVFRVYELYLDSDRELDRELQAFTDEFLVDASTYCEEFECEVNDLHSYSELIYDLEYERLNEHGKLDRFASFLEDNAAFLHDLGRKYAARPELGATFIAKSSPHKVSLNGHSQRRSLPSLIMADLDDTFICRSGNYLKEVVENLGDAYIRDMLPSDKSITFTVEDASYEQYEDDYIINELRSLGITDNVYTTLALRNDGGKARIITKAPYAIQYALSPIHDTLYRILYSLPCDYTKSHDLGADRLKELTANPDLIIDCEDQSAATDRFPAVLQRMVIEKIFSEDIATEWYRLMRLPTCIQDSNGMHDDKYYVFRVGQPMGLRTSWAAFSLTYHIFSGFIANWRDNTLSLRDFLYRSKGTRWEILQIGDDRVSLWQPEDRAVHMMNEIDIGLEINQSKSLIRSTNSSRPSHLTEFAKRRFMNGEEVSGVKPVSLSLCDNYGNIHATLGLLRSRGISYDLALLYKRVIQFKKIYGSKFKIRELDRALSIPHCMGGLAPDNGVVTCPARLLVNASFAHLRSVIKREFGWQYRSFIPSTDSSDLDEVAQAFSELPEFIDPMKTVLHKYLSSRDYSHTKYLTEIRPKVQRILSSYSDLLDAVKDRTKFGHVVRWTLRNDFVALYMSMTQAISDISDVPFYMAHKKKRYEANDMIRFIGSLKDMDISSISEQIDRYCKDPIMVNLRQDASYYEDVFSSIEVNNEEPVESTGEYAFPDFSSLFKDTSEPSEEIPMFTVTGPTAPRIDIDSCDADELSRMCIEDYEDAVLVAARGRALELLRDSTLGTTVRISLNDLVIRIGDRLTEIL